MSESYLYIIIIFIAFFIFRYFTKTNNQSTLSECSICNEVFDEIHIIELEDMPFCKTHAKNFIDSEWEIVDQVDCTPNNQKDSVDLYENKLLDYKKGELGFIKTAYRESNTEIIYIQTKNSNPLGTQSKQQMVEVHLPKPNTETARVESNTEII